LTFIKKYVIILKKDIFTDRGRISKSGFDFSKKICYNIYTE
jgi:hypothetical protein